MQVLRLDRRHYKSGKIRRAMSSRIPGFYKLSVEERLKKVAEFAGLSDEEVKAVLSQGLPLDVADRMIENVIGTFELPLGIATNFLIDGKDYLIPMAIEEPSVVAAASNAARMARESGGFTTDYTGSLMIGQIQVTKLLNPNAAKFEVLRQKDEIIERANECDPMLVNLGGGCKDIEARVIDTIMGKMLIVHLIVDVKDAMGANAVNTMCEKVAPFIERITGGKVYLRIISNLAAYRLARAKAVFDKDVIGGEEVVEGIMLAYAFAAADPFRCATHNKGIMNGISALMIATGNDFRAIEAGAHSYAAIGGYKPLTTYEVDRKGNLVGTIEIPMAVGVIGGATKVNPLAKISLKILGVNTAEELARVAAALGLAQNFAALRALATEGIQRGHMELHARNLAIMAGATGDEVDRVVEIMVRDGKIRLDYAKEVLERLRS
ncbi:hydroxymethylglutaryl-CoA reductase, degradative [Archaeoglobus sp.]|jgi:hydroxymethylglutaryl-CoA reductase|uniref:3-hydroxy-3-methylglutaryl-coenzyme A reductase n=2 Tax=Archaeoglobus fulgidus TaxID=2234 RepID=HMDH_ARCFU|nr:RecName: Full=3-hydroxy-3-methylglutaryl-coenzyme A reductase; Short=HMG-CoA reductase [Archaeoglobus fulgidus DSM 4304]AAB89513.1 3-hydroxy-3-methylglutaryl-coenzyme A reductase (mvaA) [Archaeoglobus fulgidus DSM 4304]